MIPCHNHGIEVLRMSAEASTVFTVSGGVGHSCYPVLRITPVISDTTGSGGIGENVSLDALRAVGDVLKQENQKLLDQNKLLRRQLADAKLNEWIETNNVEAIIRIIKNSKGEIDTQILIETIVNCGDSYESWIPSIFDEMQKLSEIEGTIFANTVKEFIQAIKKYNKDKN